ncbi:MAG TPA: hypothetical protein VHF89_12270 [Solirubrobacteraceae bacterium]|nr:hypothetical protein [Solirubrobacteraceae bacterium]
MRPAVDLIELPFAFTQLRPLMPSQFIGEARKRGVPLDEHQLEALHRLRLLPPFLRVQRDGRAIAALRRSDPRLAHHVATSHPTDVRDLREARAAGRLLAPAAEHFIARRRLVRVIDGRRYRSSEYLYSHHQLVHLPTVRRALPLLRRRRGSETITIDATRASMASAVGEAKRLTEIIVAVSALEAAYHPDVVETLQLPDRHTWDEYRDWREGLAVNWAVKWLGVDPAWIRDAGSELLRLADDIDPLGEWLDVVREADPRAWRRLRGAGRNAIDIRVAAEVLLRHYDDLARARRAPRLPAPVPHRHAQFDTRLKRRGRVDDVLTRFGLSPHPRLLLVVEGATEARFFPRVLRMFGIRTDPDYISVVDREGVGRDIAALIAYAAAPITELERDGRDLRLLRTATRVLVVGDAERPMASAAERERKRGEWVDRLLRTLPPEQRTGPARESLDLLVQVDTWNRHGESFEFAHFSDRELARAIATLDTRRRQPTPSQRVESVRRVRSRAGNLKSVLPREHLKLELAEALWPVLEAKIRRAKRRGTERRIPIVRVVDLATQLATEFPRGTLLIPLDDDRGG